MRVNEIIVVQPEMKSRVCDERGGLACDPQSIKRKVNALLNK